MNGIQSQSWPQNTSPLAAVLGVMPLVVLIIFLNRCHCSEVCPVGKERGEISICSYLLPTCAGIGDTLLYF